MSPIETGAEGSAGNRAATRERRCIVTGERLPRADLIRFVVGPDEIVVPDLAERLPGRGLWVTGSREVVAQACAKQVFSRAARRAVTPLVGSAGENLAALVETQLAQRCLSALGLGLRAGEIVTGFEKVRAALKAQGQDKGRARAPVVLLTASDAADDGRTKLTALAGRIKESGIDLTHLALFDAKTMGEALGREQVVHLLAVPTKADSPLSAALVRLANYRGEISDVKKEDTKLASSNLVELD